VEDENGKQ